MNYRTIAIYKLLSCNYRLFIPLNSHSNDIVLVLKDSLKLCILRPTRDTGTGPNLLFGDIYPFSEYDYVIAVDKQTQHCWLIPEEDLDNKKKSMMLSAFANNYSLVPNNVVARVVQKRKEESISKVVKEVAKPKKVKITTNEGILDLLEKGQ